DIAEADRRRLYLDYGFDSLYKYLLSRGYPSATAQRRIDAARLHNEVPITNDIESGSLNLGQITILAKGLRKKTLTLEEKKVLLKKISGLDTKATQIQVCRALNLETIGGDTVQFQRDESVRLGTTFNKDQWALYERIKEVISHIEHHPDFPAVFETVGRDYLM